MASGVPITKASQYANKALERSASQIADEADSKDVKAAQDGMIAKQLSHGQLGQEIIEAARANDTVRMRAAQGILLKSEAGRRQFHSTDRKSTRLNSSH